MIFKSMMAYPILFCLLFFLSAQAQDTKDLLPADEQTPAYRVLYESGFYKEAIEFLEEKLKTESDANVPVMRQYLAYSYILIGNENKAIAVFREMLDHDSLFRMDTVSVSSKITTVFDKALSEWKARPKAIAVFAEVESPPAPPPPKKNKIQVDFFKPWYRVPLYVSPGGAGQYYNGHYKKATLLFCIQAVALGTSIWAYEKRKGLYSEEFGLIEEDKQKSENYLFYQQLQFGIFAGTYLISIGDAFFFAK